MSLSRLVVCSTVALVSAEKPTAEIKESEGSNAKVMKLDCIVTYKGQRVTSGVRWTDGKGNERSASSHLEMALKPGANVARCLYEVGGWSGSRTITKILEMGGGGSSGSGSSSKMALVITDECETHKPYAAEER